ncbi:MAG TPA: hypothetical protein VGQ33_10205 [Vicinamibacteria bacterium]|nr:hypothetical protein [Vicinamibacteria bacterium]
MRQRQGVTGLIVAIALGVAFPALGKDLAAGLQGKWLVDKVALFEASAPPFYALATPEKKKELRESMLKDMPETVVEFAAGTLTMQMGDQTHKATYKVTKSEGQTVSFDTVSTGEKSGKPVVDKMTGVFAADGTLRLTGTGGMPPMLLKRVK